MQIVVVPALGILLTLFLECIEANLSLDFRVTKIAASPANCNVANTTYAHGETFKLDCKTQCVCENGRHACSSLCPKEQLPAPEDTISCRSPRLVEVPGHCCKMWLCENPTADVFATCHNSSTSPWTPCSRPCGLGISTRFTSTAAGCNQLSNLRLCENRKCETSTDEDNNNEDINDNNNTKRIGSDESPTEYASHLTKPSKDNKHKSSQHHKHNGLLQQLQGHHHKHTTAKKGHDCRHIERLGSARIRLGQCVSRKLYRPKLCGHCHHKTKCCVPSVSTTIQVELLCPLNAVDPISLVQRQLNTRFQQQQELQQLQFYGASTLTSLWDTRSLDAIDQEYLQSHQIHIENKFIAVEWILKCVCTESGNCERSANATTGHHSGRNHKDNRQDIEDGDAARDNDGGGGVGGNNDKRNNENFNKINMQNDKNNKDSQNNNYNNDDYNYFGLYGKINKNKFKRQHLQHIDDNTPVDNDDNGVGDGDGDDDGDGDTNINSIGGHNRQTKHHNGPAKYGSEETETWSTSLLSSSSSSSSLSAANSDEVQPDIIPYPPPPFRANKQTTSSTSSSGSGSGSGSINEKHSLDNNSSNNNSDQNIQELQQQTTAKRIKDNYQLEREQQLQQQQQYFYEQWLLQQQQQERQQALYEQLMVT